MPRLIRAVLVAACLTAGSALAAQPGEVAPAFALPEANGTAVALDQFKGRVVYVDFWASWCGPCRQSFPWLNRMQARYGAKGLRVVGVNLDARTADAERFLQEVPATFEIAFDPQGTAGRAYALKGMPSAVLLGADGRVIQVHQGFRNGDADLLETLLQQQLTQP